MPVKEKDFTVAKEKRRLLRITTTKTLNNVKRNMNEATLNDRLYYIDYLGNLIKDLSSLNNIILSYLISVDSAPDVNEKENDDCEEYNVALSYQISVLKSSIEKDSAPREENIVNLNKISLPQIPLPEYGYRKDEDLSTFIINFEGIINKYSLSNYEKFIFLQRQLKNEPLTLIKSLDSSEQNYESAKKLLTDAFASPDSQQFNAINRLLNLNFKNGDDPYQFIGDMRQIIDSFKNLNISTDIVLQYFIWRSLNKGMKQQYVTLTNNSRPTLDEIQKNIFTVTERYLTHTETAKPKHIHAATVDTSAAASKQIEKKPFCSLCSEKDHKEHSHYTKDCKRFQTPEEKIDRLRKVRGCFKCAFTNHMATKCKYKFFRSCGNCKGNHHEWLCCKIKTENKNDQNKAKNDDKNEINSQSLYVGNSCIKDYGDDSIIPTFSKIINNKIIRGMRDTGCQANLITNEAAKRLNLKVIDNKFPLSLSGFNTLKKLETKIVSLKWHEDQPPIKAICVPIISLKLNLNGLCEVVEGFTSKGYKLADEFLHHSGNVISNLDLVLGNVDCYLLPQTEILFGICPSSVYVNTPQGIMFTGSVRRILNNLKCLPNVSQSQEKPVATITTIDYDPEPTENMLYSFEVVVDPIGHIHESTLNEALEDVLKSSSRALYYDDVVYDEQHKLGDSKLNSYVLENMIRDSTGRLSVPLLWNHRMCHLLGKNYNLSKSVLKSNFERLKKQPDKLLLYDDAIKSHIAEGMLEEVGDVTSYLAEHPNVSFIPHMGIFRMSHQSTKCRVVLLSNLVEKGDPNKCLSHNQAMLSGANLNHKITTTLTKLRFDKYILGFDLVKAFLNVGIRDIDQDKLVILWYKNVTKEDYNLIALKYKRLPFGLRPSPNLLMLCLYKILVEDANDDHNDQKKIKNLIYDLSYMDNCSVTCNDIDTLNSIYKMLNSIFNPYQFSLQQYFTNEESLQTLIDSDFECEDPTQSEVKLLGLRYNRVNDTIATAPLKLDGSADTKRKVISSIASNYDVLQINGPVFNRARLYAHKLQCSPSIDWDTKLDCKQKHEWVKICRQLNSAPSLCIDRYVGDRNGEYELVAYTDASHVMLGVVIYIKDLSTKKVSFLRGNNRIVSKQLETKTTPALELHTLAHGCEMLVDTYEELCGQKSVVQIKIVSMSIYSDSTVALSWVNSYVNKLDKMQKRTPFVINRLENIYKICEKHPIKFSFICGEENPADYLTRPISYKQLSKTCYLTGPNKFTTGSDYLCFTVPNFRAKVEVLQTAFTADKCVEHIIPPNKYSDFYKLIRVHKLAMQFIVNIRKAIESKKEEFSLIKINPSFHDSFHNIIRTDQQLEFPEVYDFLRSDKQNLVRMPNLIKQLNLFIDNDDGIIRVRTKFKVWTANAHSKFPILLSKTSVITKLLIENLHKRFSHAGIYSVLNQLRKEFFVTNVFSVVKKILKTCITCKRVNEHAIKTNQSYYREFREMPPSIPFRFVFLDHFGPYTIQIDHKKTKCWVLCFSCLWSRSINLKICYDMTVKEFIRTFQLHILEWGVPQRVYSDSGTQLVAGGNLIKDLIKDSECHNFFKDYDMKVLDFIHYFKGKNELGSLVESAVKLVKRLINGSMRNTVLNFREFDLIIAQTVNLVNKRPVSFKESLRDCNVNHEMPEPITPELLLKGYELPTLNIIPGHISDEELHWNDSISNLHSINASSEKLEKVRNNLKTIYNEEFLGTLLSQASNKKDRYKPVQHLKLKPGDIILLKDEFTKSVKYPMAVVKQVFENELNEVNMVIAQKGNKELVKRHVSSVIPYICDNETKTELKTEEVSVPKEEKKKKRKAALICQQKNKLILQQ